MYERQTLTSNWSGSVETPGIGWDEKCRNYIPTIQRLQKFGKHVD